ncbi:E3 ubiquitin-protein ligase TRIM71, partial [Armadillidium nasatum]
HFTPYKISEDIPVVRSEDILLINSKEPNIDDVQDKISLNGIKSDYGLESESFYVNEVIVKFLQKNLIAKCRFKFTGNEKITFDHPIGVAELKSKEIIVADTFANRLLLFNEKCEFIRQIARIAEDGHGNVITVDSGNSDSFNIVFIDVTTGNMVKKIPVIDAVKPDQQCTSKPRFITFRQPSTLLVVDLGLDKVFIINVRTGMVVKSFGSSGNGIGQFRDPSGIACEADGFILVGDSRNHRIQIFTPYGEFVCVLRLDRPLRRPSGISLTQDDNG